MTDAPPQRSHRQPRLLAGAPAHLAARLEAAAGAGPVGVDGAGALRADAADERGAAHVAARLAAVVGLRAQLQLAEGADDRQPQPAHPGRLRLRQLDVAGGAEVVEAARPAGLAVVGGGGHGGPVRVVTAAPGRSGVALLVRVE